MLDVRGLSCPMPVVMVQQDVKKNNPLRLEVLLDNECSVENVTRFAANAGYSVTRESMGEDIKMVLSK